MRPHFFHDDALSLGGVVCRPGGVHFGRAGLHWVLPPPVQLDDIYRETPVVWASDTGTVCKFLETQSEEGSRVLFVAGAATTAQSTRTTD